MARKNGGGTISFADFHGKSLYVREPETGEYYISDGSSHQYYWVENRGNYPSFNITWDDGLRNKPTVGDNRLQGNEEALRFYQDSLFIDQIHHSVSCGGAMTRKRTPHNMRELAKSHLSEYYAKWLDQLLFIYLSDAGGISQDFIEDIAYAGHAGNPIQPPDPDHILFPNGKTAPNQIIMADKMSHTLIEQAPVKARMMQSQNPNQTDIAPANVEGEEHYAMVMSSYQMHDLRNDNASGRLDIQRAAAAEEGKNNPIFKGCVGMINNVVLHESPNVIRFDNYGSSGDIHASRALFMGRQQLSPLALPGA